jgi:pyruvate formate lyase activating enzyme
MNIFERDRHIYRRSGGGVTCTGGEPLLQATFVGLLLSQCQSKGIHTVLETCGFSSEARFIGIIKNIDWLFFDLKHVDKDRHIQLTGCNNSLILANLEKASYLFGKAGKTLIIRQVVVPSINDGRNIDALGKLAASLPYVDKVELLSYHGYGSYKYHALGRIYSLEHLEPPSEDDMQKYRKIIESHGIKCTISNI